MRKKQGNKNFLPLPRLDNEIPMKNSSTCLASTVSLTPRTSCFSFIATVSFFLTYNHTASLLFRLLIYLKPKLFGYFIGYISFLYIVVSGLGAYIAHSIFAFKVRKYQEILPFGYGVFVLVYTIQELCTF